MDDSYIILSLKHTSNRSLHIVMWAADHCGYAWVLPSAGRYTRDQALKLNDGEDCVAVPERVVLELAVPQPEPDVPGRRFYDTPGDCLVNSRETWVKLLAARLVGGQHKGVAPYPNWRGRSPAYKDRTRMCRACYTVYEIKGNPNACPTCETPRRRRGER